MKNYNELLGEVYEKIQENKKTDLLNQEYCEIGRNFLGFLENYELLRQIAPADAIILDLGCYMAPQVFLLEKYPAYIGVDVDSLKRFSTKNTLHYKMSIQDFLKNKFPALKGKKIFSICSAVPDAAAVAMAEEVCDNILILYPGEKTRLKIGGEYQRL